MKFSWKIFLATLLLLCVTFSTGGVLLVSDTFSSTMEQELNLAREENKLIRFAFETAAAAGPSGPLSRSFVQNAAQSIEANSGGGHTRLLIRDAQLHPLYISSGLASDSTLASSVGPGMRSYTVTPAGGRYYIQMAYQTTIRQETVYVESFRDITPVFERRDEQLAHLRLLTVALLAAGGAAALLCALWLLRPVSALAGAVRRVAAGDYTVRAQVTSTDEIGQLASDFNAMATQLEMQVAALTDSVRRQEDFIASFAHELKTPLTSVIGYADMLRSKNLPSEKSVLAADYIFREGKRLESLSLKLLDLIVMQRRGLALRELPTGRLFADARAFLEAAAGRSVRLELSADPVVLRVDPDLFTTLLFNLLDNARKAVAEEGTVWLTGERAAGGYRITVRDDGKGIPPGELPRITEAFYMVDKARARTQGGAGLGLAICAEIVRLHKGEIAFDSAPGEGTTVTVTLTEGSVCA